MNNLHNLRASQKNFFLTFLILCALFISFTQGEAIASPWVKNKNYFSKTGGKFVFGLKNATCGWMAMFAEPYKPKYIKGGHKPFEGFCIGIARGVFYTADGLVQLATFPVPIDFPDLGNGI